MNRACFIVAFSLLLGCSGELTEILVVVDSDLAVAELDAIEVRVTGSQTMSASGSLTGAPLPRTVGVVHSGGALGPIEVRVVGSLGGSPVVEAVASTSFLRGRTLVLPVFLGRNCRMVTCGDGQTCVNGTCASAAVDPSSLVEWSGTVPEVDGGNRCEAAA